QRQGGSAHLRPRRRRRLRRPAARQAGTQGRHQGGRLAPLHARVRTRRGGRIRPPVSAGHELKPPTAGSGPRTTAGPGGQDNGRSVLVRTRLRPPVRAAGTVYRHRLDRYGEASLLGQWFDQFRRDDAAAGWLSLDPSPDDLTGFIQYVVSALQVARP